MRIAYCALALILSPVLAADDRMPPSGAGTLQCTVDGLKVSLSWTAPENLTVENYIISRNGEKLATTADGTVLTYDDTVAKLGRYEYSVFAVTGKGRMGSVKGVRVGCCEAKVSSFNLTATVAGLVVTLAWTAPEGYAGQYTVARGDTEVGKTAETTLADTVAEAGRYFYSVKTDDGTLIAAGKVTVAPTDLQAPTELTCAVTLTPSENAKCFGRHSDPSAAVQLAWKNPIEYSSIQVACDDKVVGWLPGDAVAFTAKRATPGKHTYAVTGIVKGGWKTTAATCEVTVAEPPAPVTDLACALKADTADTVVLTWKLPEGVTYTAIQVSRDGTKIADLAADAVTYEDAGLKTGKYTYGVAGVTAEAASKAATCKVKVQTPAEPATFIRGDVDGDGKVEVDDALALLKWMFPWKQKGEKPACMQAADVDNNGRVGMGDVMYLMTALVNEGPAPVAPYPECGEALAPLGCEDPGSCKQ